MNKNTKVTVILVVAVVILIAGISIFYNSRQPGVRKSIQAMQGSNTNAQKVKLSDMPYWKYAHFISGETLDNEAVSALAGFKLDKQTLPDSSIQITLTTTSSRYRNQTFNVKSGEKLYFIETSYGDDAPDNDYSLGDDAGVIVDSEGYIVQ